MTDWTTRHLGCASRQARHAGQMLALAALLTGFSACHAEPNKADPNAADPVAIVAAFDNLLLNHQPRKAILTYMSDDFIEHNPSIKGGNREGLLEHVGLDGAPSAYPDNVDVVDRRFGSGEFVVTQHHVFRNKQDRGSVFVDTYRVVNGKIVEHWDVIQPVPEKTTDNPHSMW